MALWDLCGKAAGKPVHALLGGATRDVDHALCLAAAGGRALRAVSRRAVRLGRTRQDARLQGDEDRDHHERPLCPWRHARKLRPPYRGAGRRAQDGRARHHADGRRAVSLGGRRHLPVGRQGLGGVRLSISSRRRCGRTMSTRWPSSSSMRRCPSPSANGWPPASNSRS